MSSKPFIPYRIYALHYAAALAAVAVAGLLRLSIEPAVGNRFPFVTFLPAMAFIAWYCLPGAVAMGYLLSLLAGALFVPPLHSFLITGRAEQVGFVLYAGAELALIALIQNLRLANAALREEVVKREGKEALLREADRKKDEFLAMLGHELRNPLAAMTVALCLWSKGATNERLPFIKQALDRQTKQLCRLVDDLLDVSRITRGKLRLQLETLSVVQTVKRAVEASRPMFDSRKHNLSLDLPSCDVFVRGDDARLEQILTNLLSNAAKYTEPGGKIVVSVDFIPGWVTIRVKDNGRGIPRGAQTAIFEMFSQLTEPVHEKQASGLGVGLYLVRKLVELQGGSVSVISDGLNKGSEFIVRLPDFTPVNKLSSEGNEAKTTLEQPLRLLIVEDNPDIAEMFAGVLEQQGHVVAVAQDGGQALEAAKMHRPDVVLLDINLPVLDGYEVARRLRQELNMKQMLIIAISGYGQDADIKRSLKSGCNAHLIKPVDLDKLMRTIAMTLQTATPQETA